LSLEKGPSKKFLADFLFCFFSSAAGVAIEIMSRYVLFYKFLPYCNGPIFVYLISTAAPQIPVCRIEVYWDCTWENQREVRVKSYLYFPFKGTVSRNFFFLVFCMGQFPPSPRVSH
jgi:hypothetical protein